IYYISLYSLFFFFSILPPPPRSTLFPYTTLFRSSSRFRLSITTARFRNNLIRNSNRNQLHFHHLTRIRLSRRSWMIGRRDAHERSEEHTSELQSRSDLVCRLLLEKKKKT